MSGSVISQLELLAEIDTLVEDLRTWADSAPAWEPARTAQKLIHRLLERLEGIRIRMDAPLVVATLGGTGTGKSALLNAILGKAVLPTGQIRPTTCKPVLVCRPDIQPEMLGIEPSAVELCPQQLPVLEHLVLVDCPDPDTSESAEEAGSNLARLRHILPYCDVLLITGTQQKYRSGRIAEELARTATGARLIFVQTHADTDDDIRPDWQKVLESEYVVHRIFRIDSVRALEDARLGRPQQAEMADLLELLTRQLAGTAAGRIRRANLLDLAAQALARCTERVQQTAPALEVLRQAFQREKHQLLNHLVESLQKQLESARRDAENRLLGEIISCWGSSPWAWVLRIYQSLGMVLLGLLGRRLSAPAALVLWGGAIGWQIWRKRQTHRPLLNRPTLRTMGWLPDQVEEVGIRLQGYAWEAGLPAQIAQPERLFPQMEQSAYRLLSQLSAHVDQTLGELAARHSRWYVRGFYEILFGGVIAVVLYRLAKNYFWDSWLDPTPDAPPYGLDFYLTSLFWLLVWGAGLVWIFLNRIRHGMGRHIRDCLQRWRHEVEQMPIFGVLEQEYEKIRDFQADLARLRERVESLRLRLALPEGSLARRRTEEEVRREQFMELRKS